MEKNPLWKNLKKHCRRNNVPENLDFLLEEVPKKVGRRTIE